MNKSTVFINGRSFDAVTGKPHDGVIHPVSHHLSATKPTFHDVARPGVKHAHPHAPKRASTLARHAVIKPAITTRPHSKASAPLPSHKHFDIVPSPSIKSAHHLHPRHVKKSPLISHFGAGMPLFAAPDLPTISQSLPSALPVIPGPIRTTAKPASEALFEKALEHATSHEQPQPKIGHRSLKHPLKSIRKTGKGRLNSAGTLVIAAVVLSGIIAYSNLSTIKVQVASAHAGFSASLPAYQPAGYRLSHLAYGHGQVSLRFAANGGNYAIIQKPSAWDSQTLHDSYVASLGQNYETVETAGRTLYVYGQSNATWVSDGVWYQVESNSLSIHQLVQLAASM